MTPWTVAYQAPLPMGILQARILKWVTIYPSPGDVPNPGIEPVSLISPALVTRFFTISTTSCLLLFENLFCAFILDPKVTFFSPSVSCPALQTVLTALETGIFTLKK
ncbi:unnamed protein product [Rangifer tarandus platyrhynchus]|uniref:Uncharacterized protein n=1 Tax=Rangifer tarandus platyrhynchus TaxID=3082113 RepID=A0AC59YMU0_RANTA